MTAKDYAVKHPYGATYSPWSKTSPHRGNDRPCPSGTVVSIAGINCGLTGNTGESSAPHLHTQEGTDPAVQNTVKPTNEFKPGTVTSVRTTDSGAWGKYFTIKVGSRYVTYAHLSKVNVKLGDVIKENFVIEEQRPVFNPDYYLKANPDVARVSNTQKFAKEHWLKHGIKEGRNSAPNFHVKEYLANYADLRRVHGNTGYAQAIKHYYNSGINEGRSGRKINPITNAAQSTLDKIKALLK